VLCYLLERGPFASSLPDQSHLEWTDDNTSIYAHAVRNDLGDLSLYEWWLTSAGPVPPGDVAGVVKDRPSGASVIAPADGSYLATTGPCSERRNGNCILRIEDSFYDIRNFDQDGSFQEGTVSLRKPNSVIFTARAGFCLNPDQDPRPATYTWTDSGDRVSFDLTGGGRCAGPGFTGPWTRAPEGVIAVGSGHIELVDTGGDVLLSTTQGETGPNDWPDWSPDGTRIVFAGASTEGYDLYVMNADGTDIERITETPGDEVAPAWSPDGERILYRFDDGGEQEFRVGLATVRPDGSGVTELLGRDNEAGSETEIPDLPQWSPDGSRIAFAMYTTDDIVPYVMDADGTDPIRLRDQPGVPLAWTPDGERIVLSADGSFVSVLPDGSGERVFVEDPPAGGQLVIDWSPDGEWIAMSSPTGVGIFDGRLYLMRGDGSEIFQVGLGTEPSWRPEAR
jgi:TolB protein